MIAVIDYGVGNLFSLNSSLKFLGLESVVTSDAAQMEQADQIILPGVGAFADAIAKLRQSGLAQTVLEQAQNGKPLLGICLGMQLLFEKSHEYGEHEGLGLLRGEICPIANDLTLSLKVPHIGWNSLRILKESPLLKYTKDGEYVYYVHSFYAKNCTPHLIAASEYEIPIAGVVGKGRVFGTQFHPEKSGETGLRLLKAFSEIKG